MNKLFKDLLIGTLMGDAHIRRVGLDKAYVTFEQSSKKRDYINFLFEQAKDSGILLKSDELKTYARSDSRYNIVNNSLYFRTEASEELKEMADLFLDDNNKKVIPSNIGEHLNHRSLAYWIMDDGQRVARGGVTLCTDSYSHSEIETLREALASNFNFTTSIHNKKNKEGTIYERIYINKSSLEDQKDLLVPHLHESMLYKINQDVILKQDSSDMGLVETDVSDNPLGLFEE